MNCEPAPYERIRPPSDALQRPLNLEAFSYWSRIREGRPMPARRDLDPLDIPRLLPSILLIDVLHEPRDLRYRLVGTRWVWHFDRDDTGRLMSEIPHQAPPSLVWDACWTAVDARRPHAPDGIPYVGRRDGYGEIECVIMPMSRDGDSVNMLLISVDFTRDATGRPWFSGKH